MNDRFEDRRLRHRRLLEIALIVSLGMHIFLLQGYKRIGIKPMSPSTVFDRFHLFDVPVTEWERSKPPPKRPSVPIPMEEEFLVDEEYLESITGLIIDETYVPPDPEPTSEDDMWTFIPVEQDPSPVGGYTAIHRLLDYPVLARKSGVEGRVTVRVLIDENGHVLRAVVIQGIGAGCDEAAVEAVRRVGWNPAMQRDRPVKVWVSVPVEFRLTRS